MLIPDRIRLIMKSQNLSASEFADTIGIKRSNLSHVLSGRNKPSLDFLAKIIESFPKVNASWLITGEAREGTFNENTNSSAKKLSPQLEEKSTQKATVQQSSDRELVKMIAFYSDGTYETLKPSAE